MALMHHFGNCHYLLKTVLSFLCMKKTTTHSLFLIPIKMVWIRLNVLLNSGRQALQASHFMKMMETTLTIAIKKKYLTVEVSQQNSHRM